MKIIHKDIKQGKISIKTESIDDLWCLSQIIDVHDFVSGKTLRKIKIGDETQRAQKVVRKPMHIGIEVEKTDFGKGEGMLHISGIVREGPEDVPRGSYHSFNMDTDSCITIEKKRWLKYHLDKLNEACTPYDGRVLLCVFDREEAHFALMKRYGYEFLSSMKGNVAKKDERAVHETKNFYDEIIRQMQDYVQRYLITQVIIGSPAFWKDELQKEIKDANLRKMITFATCSSVSPRAFDEVLKRAEVQNLLNKERITKEVALVEELLAGIAKDGPAVYGLNDTKAAADSGAVNVLLITDNLIRKTREDGNYAEVERIMEIAESMGGTVNIISSENEAGSKLDGIGGIGAILRYKLNY